MIFCLFKVIGPYSIIKVKHSQTMRIHRFYTTSSIDTTGKYVLTDEMLLHQLIHVFRYKTGQEVILFDGSGFEYKAKITDRNKKSITFSIEEKKEGLVQTKNLKSEVIFCFSLIKKDNIEHILQKGTELGVTEFYPLISERSEKKDFNEERGVKIITEAVEQSGWSILPVLHKIQDLESVIKKTQDSQQIVFSTVTQEKNKEFDGRKFALFVGPEGGWSDTELELFNQYKIEPHSLGEQVLRAETAAISGVSRFL